MARKQRPFQTARVRKMKPIRAKVPPPEPESRTIHSVFFDVEQQSTPSASVEIAAFSRRKSQTTWRVDLQAKAPVETRFSLAPRAEERIVTRAIRNRARKVRELEPVRPAWIDQRFVPQAVPRTARRRLVHRGAEVDPLIIFPPDGRRVYNDPTYPWRCVGRITSNGPPRGSGVLIGPRHVLTASHVINWSNPGCTFRAHQFDNSNLGSSFATSIWHYEKLSDVDSENVEEDYVVIVLNSKLGDQLGFLGAKEYDDDWDGDRSGRASAMPRTWEEPTVQSPGRHHSGRRGRRRHDGNDDDEWRFRERAVREPGVRLVDQGSVRGRGHEWRGAGQELHRRRRGDGGPRQDRAPSHPLKTIAGLPVKTGPASATKGDPCHQSRCDGGEQLSWRPRRAARAHHSRRVATAAAMSTTTAKRRSARPSQRRTTHIIRRGARTAGRAVLPYIALGAARMLNQAGVTGRSCEIRW